MEIKLVNAEGWLKDVYHCLLRIGKNEFSLSDVYGFEAELSKKYPNNNHVREKIRQQLQRLRDIGQIEFLGGGTYCLK
ncbi:Dam-replacing domain protein [Phyllobacterium phragmitis]|uniref:Dam-replacing domain protein n=1 Tax=Phyllobacterium phragmitis TaxID=2670329 RepID=A0A2S9IXG9_9HYPH|nr:Dam-replacing domain protein [Phyllobacterium phragmitis]